MPGKRNGTNLPDRGRGSEIGLRKNTSTIATFVHQELLRLQAIRCNLLLLPQFAGGKRQERAGKNANGELTGVSPARTRRRTDSAWEEFPPVS
jgi:hypothetical protein